MKKARLGRGLDTLLGGNRGAGERLDDDLRQLPLDSIQSGRYQPRTRMDDESLEELAASIRSQGVVQPVLVRETPTGRYELIAGERRWRAARLAGLETVPAVVRRIADEAALAVGLIENIQRENLNPIEEAAGFKRLLDEFGLTHQQVADGVGRSRSAVTNALRLLSLRSSVKERLERGEIETGHARALLALPGEDQAAVADRVVSDALSVRQTEALVRQLLGGQKRSKKRPAQKSADIRDLEQRLSDALAAKVTIQHQSRKGRLVIEYHSLDELDGIIEKIDSKKY